LVVTDAELHEDGQTKPDSIDTIFISASDLPSQQHKDENHNSNLTTPKILKQNGPIFSSHEISDAFKKDNQVKKSLLLSKKTLDLNQVNISPIKFKSYTNDRQISKSPFENKSFNSSLLSFENSLFLNQHQKTSNLSFNKNFHDPFKSYEKLKDKSKNDDATNNNSYKNKSLNVYNEIRGYNSNSEHNFENPFLSKTYSNDHERKNDLSLPFQSSFDFEAFQKNESRNFSSKPSINTKQNSQYFLPKSRDKYESNAFEKINNLNMNSSYEKKNYFDFENEESSNHLFFENSLKGDEDIFIRAGERGF